MNPAAATPNPAVSAALICQNEERSLARCLASLAWCDEIVVVDGGSTDRSRAIATDPASPWAAKLRWLERPFDTFRLQRNFSLASCRNDWIFVVDCDEACSPELAARIRAILSAPEPGPYWKVRRQEYFLGKPVNFGVWNPSYQDRFFRRAGVEYINDIHEYPRYASAPGRIHEPLLHDPTFNPERFLAKMNKYTSIEARARVASGYRTNVFRMMTTGPAMFLKNYFYYRAYRDGVMGVAISLLEGVSRVVRHVKIWQYQNEAKSGKPGGAKA